MKTNSDAIVLALNTVEGELDSDDRYDQTFEVMERFDLEEMPYEEAIEVGRSRFSALIVSEFLTILAQRDCGYAFCGKVRGWLLKSSDEFLIDVALRMGCEWRLLFYQSRIRSSLLQARSNFPHLAERIDIYLSCGPRPLWLRVKVFFLNPTDRGNTGV